MNTATEWKVREILFTLSRMFGVSAAGILRGASAEEALDARALAIWAMWQVGVREELQRPMAGKSGFKADFILASMEKAVDMMDGSPQLKKEMDALVARAGLIRDVA